MSRCPCLTDETLLRPHQELQEAAQEHLQHCLECNGRRTRLVTEQEVLRSIAGLPELICEDDFPEADRVPASSARILQHDREWELGLATSNVLSSTGEMDLEPDSDSADLVGRQIGRYRLLALLSRGGQASVYRGWDGPLRRDVAIKVSRFGRDRAAASSRVLQEGMILACIDHPHLARVHDVGMYDGHPYLVMELVEGTTLRDYVLRGLPSSVEVRRILLEVGSALAAAHEKGILHLDVKPENVMVQRDGSCKLIDFGMGITIASRRCSPLKLVLGTDGYMSPEQRRGELAELTAAADVFGLGGLLYFLLTGHAPCSGKTRTHDSGQQVDDEPARIGLTDLRITGHELAAICRRALAASPADRYSSVEALLDDLRSVSFAENRRGAKSRVIAVPAVTVLLAVASMAWLPFRDPGLKPLHPRSGHYLSSEIVMIDKETITSAAGPSLAEPSLASGEESVDETESQLAMHSDEKVDCPKQTQ